VNVRQNITSDILNGQQATSGMENKDWRIRRLQTTSETRCAPWNKSKPTTSTLPKPYPHPSHNPAG